MAITTFKTRSYGLSADIKHNNVFVWNSDDSSEYATSADYTFCINTPNGLSDVYIKNKSLNDCIDEKINCTIGIIDKKLNDILN